MRITGTVITGKSEGRAYLARPEYRRQFQQRLDVQPYPGTLNLKLQGQHVERFASLKERQGVRISGFEDHDRTFGDVSCFPCQVNDTVEGIVVIPEKSVYGDVMEIVAEVCLRDALNLQDGDPVTVDVTLDG